MSVDFRMLAEHCTFVPREVASPETNLFPKDLGVLRMFFSLSNAYIRPQHFQSALIQKNGKIAVPFYLAPRNLSCS